MSDLVPEKHSREELVIIGVRADPKPHDAFRLIQPQSAVMCADANRLQLADFLEVERRVFGIRFE